MAGLNTAQVRVAGTGNVYVATVGTTAPTNATTALNAAFIDLGYTSEDGVTLSKSIDRSEVDAWQSTVAVRYLYGATTLNISMNLIQSNDDVGALWWGSSFTGTSPNLQSDMPLVPTGVQKAVVLQWIDGSVNHRLYIPKAEVTDTGDLSITRTGAVTYPITFTALAPTTGTVIASWFANDAAFAPLSSQSAGGAGDRVAARVSGYQQYRDPRPISQDS